MKDIVSCIEELRLKLDRHRKGDLKEYPTRTIFIDLTKYNLNIQPLTENPLIMLPK
jgi:hypothetical protein